MQEKILLLVVCIIFAIIIVGTKRLSKEHTNTFITSFAVLIMKFAEKYISQNGNTKMEFCVNCIIYIYKIVNKYYKINIPTKETIQEYLQFIFNEFKIDINAVKNIYNKNEQQVEIETKDLIKDEKQD